MEATPGIDFIMRRRRRPSPPFFLMMMRIFSEAAICHLTDWKWSNVHLLFHPKLQLALIFIDSFSASVQSFAKPPTYCTKQCMLQCNCLFLFLDKCLITRNLTGCVPFCFIESIFLGNWSEVFFGKETWQEKALFKISTPYTGKVLRVSRHIVSRFSEFLSELHDMAGEH